jgi:hypothetical protein
MTDFAAATRGGHAVAFDRKEPRPRRHPYRSKALWLASSYIVDAVRADAPKFGFTPDASAVPLRG